MNMPWNIFGAGQLHWTGVDTAPDGRLVAANVRGSQRASDLPKVLLCAESGGVAMGVQALEELAQKLGAPKRWTCALARGDYQMLVMPEPPVQESEMEASLRWSLAALIDFPVDQAGVAWMRIPTAEFLPAHEHQVYAVVSRQAQLDEQARMFQKAKVPLRAIDVRETALRNIAALVENPGEGVGLLAVGPAGVSSTFTYRGELYLDRFIAQPMAEIYAGDTLRQQKFFDRVVQQVYQSIELIARSHPFFSIDRVVIAPLPEPMDLLPRMAAQLGVPVQSLDLATVFDLSAVPELLAVKNQSRYLVALGAALRGSRRKSV